MCDLTNPSTEHIRDKVCRLCLEECSKLAHLENLYFDEICFLDILRDCFQIEINVSHDHLPLWICQKCVTISLNFYTFKNTIFENEVFLQSVNLDEINLKLKQNSQIEQEKDLTRISTNVSTNVGSLIQFYNKGNHPKSTQTKIHSVKSQGKDQEDETSSDNASTAESGISCSICSSFDTQNHSKTMATSIPTKQCKHVKTTEKRYVCMTCKKQFSTPHEWKEHTILHYSTHKYPCLQCNESFDSKHELVVHNYTHLYKENGEKQSHQLMTRVKHKLRDKRT